MLVEHLLEFGDLFLVWLEADHFEDSLKCGKVDSHIAMAIMVVVRLQVEDLLEVLLVQFTDARLMVRVVRSGHHFILLQIKINE